MDGVILVLLGVLAAAVVYIITSLRNYQRVDYSQLLVQEEYVRALDSRIEYLEQMIADQQLQNEQRERELTALLTAAQQHLAAEVRRARETIIEEVLASPQQLQGVQQRESVRRQAEQGVLSQQAAQMQPSPQRPQVQPQPAASRPQPLPVARQFAQPQEVPLPEPQPITRPSSRRASNNPNLVTFLRNPKQSAIASYLEAGHRADDIARLLNVSRHEVELVESVLFRNALSA